jgi:hypothetical protein
MQWSFSFSERVRVKACHVIVDGERNIAGEWDRTGATLGKQSSNERER